MNIGNVKTPEIRYIGQRVTVNTGKDVGSFEAEAEIYVELTHDGVVIGIWDPNKAWGRSVHIHIPAVEEHFHDAWVHREVLP